MPAPSSKVAPSTPAASALRVDDPILGSLSWLAGTWLGDDDEGPHTVEAWLWPEGGSMLGISRTVADGHTVFFEYLRIEGSADGVAYLASPRGRDPPTRFERADEGPQWIAFENPAHDFPQRIEYRREGARLTMTISGQEHGAPKTVRWSMHLAEEGRF